MDQNDRMTQAAGASRVPFRGAGTLLGLARRVVLAAGGAWLVFTRAVYHEWPWSAYPSILHA